MGKKEVKQYIYYEVEKIISQKKLRGKTYYLVKWKDYSTKENSWVIEDKLNCDKLLRQFKKQQPKRHRLKKINYTSSVSGSESDLDLSQNESEGATESEYNPKANSEEKQKSTHMSSDEQSIHEVSSSHKVNSRNCNEPPTGIKDCAEDNQSDQGQKSAPNLIGQIRGGFELGDVPQKILQAKIDQQTKAIIYTVYWLPRKNGFQPLPSDVTNMDFRTYNYSGFLLDYYESRIRLVPKKAL